MLKGDVRVMKESTRQTIHQQIVTMNHGLEAMFGVQTKLDYDDNYPVLINDATLTNQAMTAIKAAKIPQITAIKDTGVQDPSEDFAYFAQKVPSSFFYIGCQLPDGSNHPHHSNRG